MIREITENDFDQLLRLYMQLHDNPFPEKSERVLAAWNSILADENHHIIVAEEDGNIASSCVCVIIPNLTRGQRPYAFVENVITDEKYRKKGLATACLDYARELAPVNILNYLPCHLPFVLMFFTLQAVLKNIQF